MTLMIAVAGIVLIAFIYSPGLGREGGGEERSLPLDRIDGAMAADLIGAALRAGTSIPGALRALDTALEEEGENHVNRAAQILLMGGQWEEAWSEAPEHLHPVRDALEPAWTDGAAPLPLLERCADTIRQSRDRKAREAAAKLGTKLVMPLGLCFLPAFVVLGIIPVIAAAGITIFG
ncbi:MAG: type II secretion system F family protein [Ancrocorticia sp.]|uniref:type II secretion system F family protein n=1 Tax=Ancrocorticia sp. TaxID=2593684 RepID=UPI003F8F734E